MDYQFNRHYTLEEANVMLPHVRRVFREVHVLLKLEGEKPAPKSGHYANGNGNGSANGHSNGNGNGNGHELPQPDMADYSDWSDEKRREAAYRLLNALQSQGIVIQDVQRGLIDFPSIQDGEEVFLCYELKDGHLIEYFHSLESGYAGRQKISEKPGE